MVILLRYTSAFSEVIYADFYAKILDWNFCLVHVNSQILVVVFVSKLNFSFSFRFIDENSGIFVVVIVFVTKINLFSSTKIFVFVVVFDEKKHCLQLLSFCRLHPGLPTSHSPRLTHVISLLSVSSPLSPYFTISLLPSNPPVWWILPV